MPTPSPCQIIRLGTVEYHRAWELQLELAAKVHDGAQPNTLLLLEHSPVYTKGRLSKPEHILLSDEELRQKGIGVYEADRGGQVTFHGPGQLVAYPVVDLREWGGPVKYVRTLERIIVDSLADFKITAETIDGITGVWVDGAKIAAIGVKISRGVAYHGFAINVTTDLSYYSHIVPCGIADRPVTSMAKVLGEDVDMGMAQYSLAYQFGKGMGFRMVEAELEPIQI
ncbi:MAG TPA: lipoyl(octanoyl) transferase LipB [Dehalococcoidia bacterium]|nr:lipoyl(octanoyl) transferase LipB [Dehalococcoidia bacterium]